MQRKAAEAEEENKAKTATIAATSASEHRASSPTNGSTIDVSTGNGYNSADDEDDAGPLEIMKQGPDERGNGDQDGDTVENEDDISGAQHERMPAPGRSTTNNGGVEAGTTVTGESSSELRAQQGKEDRPVFDMFSAAALTAGAAVGPATKMGGKGGGGGGGEGGNMAYLGDDGGGDQVCPMDLMHPCVIRNIVSCLVRRVLLVGWERYGHVLLSSSLPCSAQWCGMFNR